MNSVLLGSLIISRIIQPPGPLVPLVLQIKGGQPQKIMYTNYAFTAFTRNIHWHRSS